MKKFVVLCAIVLISKLSANCDLIDSYTVAVEYNTLLERECSSLMGGGGIYYGKIVEASESSPVSCDGIKRSDGYVVIYGCNTCTSKNVQERLEQDTIACTKQCRTTMNNCVYDGISNDWGGYYNTDQHPSCSPLKSTSLPGCAESSSSETVESSSSEVVESSSSEEIDSSSSDDDESSSSSGGEECGTGTGHCPVSSSGSGKINSSSGAHGSGGGERGTQCYIGDEESCHPWSGIILFKRRPVVLGEIKLYGQQPYCREDGNIVFRAGIPIAYFRASSWLCLKEDCISYHSIEGFWECNEGSVQNNGCSAEPEHRSLPFYYYVQTGNLIASWGLKVDFSSTPESGMNLAYFDVNDLLNIVAREGVYVDGDDGLSYDLTDLYPQFSGNSFDDYVRACAYHLNIDVSSSSEVGSSSSSSSLFVLASSSSVQSSSSEESSSSIGKSSSSENSSSSVEMEFSSSSDETESSSSNGNESSSSLGDEASSSSLQIESSSSEFVYSSSDDGCFVPGGDQVHSPNQIFSDCLDNMEPGKCYSINPDRGTQYGWMNTDAQDSWWWREVDCETGEKVDRNRVGACPGFPLDNVPSNPKQSCIAYNGKCYRCKSENSYVDCSQEWLWKWNFNEQNIGSWYAEVDCYNPFEENFDGQCPDRFYLEKSATNNHEYFKIKKYTVEYSVSQKDHDALGRRLNGKRPKFLRTFKKRENKNTLISSNTFDVGSIIYIPIEKMELSQKILAKQGDQCPDYPCGNLGSDYGNGKDIGVYCGYPCTKLNMENGFLRIEVKEKVQTGSCGVNNPRYTITFKIPATATIKRKGAYYIAPVGYKMGITVVTKDAYDAAERHEIGHMESYSCLEEKNMFKSYYEFVLENVCEKNIVCDENDVLRDMVSSIKKKMDPKTKTGIDELVRYNNELWQRMCGWYHETFSHEDGPGGPGKPAELTCPSTNTLLKKEYDLTGCEVH